MSSVANAPQRLVATVTTNAAGAADVDVGPFRGFLEKIIYTKVDYADTVDFTITDNQTAEDLWNEDNVTASQIVRPTALDSDLVGGARATVRPIYIDGDVSIVLANGGDTKSGTFEILCIGA